MKDFKNKTQFVFSNEFVGFTTIPNTILNDTSISFKALGIYCKILQFQNSPKHKIYQCAFKNYKTDGESSIASGFAELISAGYIKKEYQRNEKNQFCGIIYTVYMTPKKVDKSNDFPETRFSHIGNTSTGKPSTKKKIIKKIIKKKIKSSDDPKKILDDIINNNIDNIKTIINIEKMKKDIIEKYLFYQKNIKDSKKYLEQVVLNYINNSGKNKNSSKNKFTDYKQDEPDWNILAQIERNSLYNFSRKEECK